MKYFNESFASINEKLTTNTHAIIITQEVIYLTNQRVELLAGKTRDQGGERRPNRGPPARTPVENDRELQLMEFKEFMGEGDLQDL